MKGQFLYFNTLVFFLFFVSCVDNNDTLLSAEKAPNLELPSGEIRDVNGIQHIDGVLRISDEFNALQYNSDAYTFADLDIYYKNHLASDLAVPASATRADRIAIDNMRSSFLSLAVHSYDFPMGLSDTELKYYGHELAKWNVLIEPMSYHELLGRLLMEKILPFHEISKLARIATANNNAFYKENSDIAEGMKKRTGWMEDFYGPIIRY